MNPIDVLVMLLVGGIAGWIAGAVMRARFTLLLCVVVGIVGSFLGNWLASLLGIFAYGLLGRLVISIAGAMLLIVLLRAVRRRR